MTKLRKHTKRGPRRPLVLHLRRLRQWCGTRGISRKELSLLSGVTVRAIRDYEATRRLPLSLERLVRVAMALNRGVESLIDPRVLVELTRDIESRRGKLPKRTTRPTTVSRQ